MALSLYNLTLAEWSLFSSFSMFRSSRSTWSPCLSSSPSNYTHRLQSDFPRNPPWFNIVATVLTCHGPAIPIVFNQIQPRKSAMIQHTVVHTCQLLPCSLLSSIVLSFFQIYISKPIIYSKEKRRKKYYNKKLCIDGKTVSSVFYFFSGDSFFVSELNNK